MRLDDGAPAVVPCRKDTSAVAAVVLDVLEATDDVRNAAETAAEADDRSPGTFHMSVNPDEVDRPPR